MKSMKTKIDELIHEMGIDLNEGQASLLRLQLRSIWFDLLRVRYRIRQGHQGTNSFFIPTPFFMLTEKRRDFYRTLEVADEQRDNRFFTCPTCGRKSFFQFCSVKCRKRAGREFWICEKKLKRIKDALLSTLDDSGEIHDSIVAMKIIKSIPHEEIRKVR